MDDERAISEAPWDGSASRFTDQQYEGSCVLDRKSCGADWADKPPKVRCSLPIREPNGALSRAGVHAAASRIGSVSDACQGAIDAAKAALRSAYKQLGEDAPTSIDPGDSDKSNDDRQPGIHRDRALAEYEDHSWKLRDSSESGLLGILEGHFAVFNRWTNINSPFEGNFMERVAPGAFTKTFAENKGGMKVLLNHGKDPTVGMKPLGPIRDLAQDDHGAYYEVGLMDTSYNRDILPGLQEGLFGASFRFQVMREELDPRPRRSDENPDGLPESTITEAKVREFGPVTFPAYQDATAGLRSLNDDFLEMDLRWAASDPDRAQRFLSALRGEEVGNGTESANVGTEQQQEQQQTKSTTVTPVAGAPVRRKGKTQPRGATLTQRAVPLRTKSEQGEPKWKL